MANKVLLYFTAAAKPTTDEAADIAIFQAQTGLEVRIRNAGVNSLYPDAELGVDYVADHASGALIPVAYADTDDYPRATTANPPAPTVASTQKVISSGVEFLGPATSGSRTDGWTPTIVDGDVTALVGS